MSYYRSNNNLHININQVKYLLKRYILKLLLTLISYISLIISYCQNCFSLRDGIKFSSWLRYAWSKCEKRNKIFSSCVNFTWVLAEVWHFGQNSNWSAGSWLSYGHKSCITERLFFSRLPSKIQERRPNKGSFTWLQMPWYTVLFSLSMSNKTSLIRCRDSVLLKTGNWTKKTEVKRALKSEEISINLISSDYGRLIGMHLI